MNQRTILRSVLITVLTLVATAATAHDFEVDGIYYGKYSDGTVYVTYKGGYSDSYEDEYSGDVMIPSSVTYNETTYSVTSIRYSAFEGCSGLKSVSIPNSVTSIGNSAFRGCSGLTSVTIPNSVTYIGNEAFYKCSGLTSIIVDSENQRYDSRENCNAIIEKASNKLLYGCKNTIIPNSVTSIGDYAFWNCLGLTSITIPNSVNDIGNSAFNGCSGLTSITIPNSVTSIGDYAFRGCSGLTSVTIPNSVISIGNSAFENCSGLTSVTIGNSVPSIGNKAFYKCSLLTSVTIPNSVTSIGNEAFYGCSGLTSVTIPNSVTSIGDYAFRGCSGLTSVTIPNSVTSIYVGAFYGCSGLTSVSIPNSVTSIGNEAFRECRGLTSVNIPSSVISIRDYAFFGSGLTSVTIGNSVETIGNSAFYNCSGLTSVSIPNSVTSIGDQAFKDCRRLTSVTIPNSVTEIGTSVFSGCRGLTSVTIPNSVSSIGDYAFYQCSGLASITIGNSVSYISNSALSGCSGLTSIIVDSENQIYDSRENCNAIIETASNKLLYGSNNTIIPNSVTSIGNSAFNGYCGLTSVTIPNSVTSIGDSAFYGCSGLTSVTIGNSVTSIGKSAFWACSGLASITIGKSVTSIGYMAFFNCSGLASVISKAVTPPTCGDLVFTAQTYSAPLIVPSVAKDAYKAKSPWSNFSNYAEPNKKITAIAINNNEANLVINNTLQLTAIVKPEDATFADVLQWTSSNPEVATVDDNGLVTAIAKGDAEIKVMTCDGSNLSASCTIKVALPTSHNFEVGGIYYKFNGKGTVEVTFKGDYPDAYDEYSGDVVIPSSVTFQETPYSVTSIGDHAFYRCSGLTSVTIGNSVTDIGQEAFRDCSGLTSVTIPNSVTSIGEGAFIECSGLTSVTIPNSVNLIGDYAFFLCSGLTSIKVDSENKIYDSRENCNAIIKTATNTLHTGCNNTIIPNSVTSIGNGAFAGCSGLTSITIPNSVTSIGDQVFVYCSGLTSITIPNSVISIGNGAFGGCSGLTSVTIGNSVTSIGDRAFQDCSVLTSVTIGNSVTSIGENAFAYSGLTSVTIPKFVTSIGDYAFYRCSGLTSVISKAVTPPTCGSDAFSTETYSKLLIVPSVAKEAYKAAPIWSNFSNYAETERKITAMEFGASTFGIENGETLQLTAKVTPEDATFADVLQWTSSNTEVATVDNEGLVTTLAPGSTVIKATSCDGSNISATCTVVVCQKAANVNDLVSGSNIVGFGLQGVKMHNGVLYACTTTESVNKSTPDFHGNDANNMAPYEDRNFAEFDQRDWVAISGLEEGFVGKELSYPFEANFADGVLTPSETIKATAATTAYNLNTFRAENILHGGYSNYAEDDYTAYYVPARVNEVAKFMGLIETVDGAKYLYSDNAYGRKDGEGIKVEGTIADNSKVYSLLEGILVADKSTKAGVKIIMLDYLGEATGVEGVDSAAARIYSANGNIIIAATEDGEAAVYDYTGRLIKSVPVVAGDNTAVPVMPGCYIVRTGVKTQSVVVK